MFSDAMAGNAAAVVGVVIYIVIISSSDPMVAWTLIGTWLASAMVATRESTRTLVTVNLGSLS